MTQKEIIQGCIRGDSSAREALYVKYYPRLLTLCKYYLDSEEIAQDLIHDSFIIIFSSIGNLRDPEKLEPWMGSIVRNLSIDYLKLYGHKGLWDENANLLIPEEDSEGIKIPPFEDLIKMVDDLPERYGQVFRMSVLHGLSNKEIADILQIREHTASSDLSRARKLLKEAIKRYWALNSLILVLLIGTLLIFTSRTGEKEPELEAFTSEQEVVIPVIEITVPDYAFDENVFTEADYPKYKTELKNVRIAALPIPEKKAVIVNQIEDNSIIPEEKAYSEEDPFVWIAPEIKKNNSRRVELALSGNLLIGSGATSIHTTIYDASLDPSLPPKDNTENPVSITRDNIAKHHYPIRLGLMTEIQLRKALSLRVGMEYSYLSSTMEDKHTRIHTDQKLHYLAVPLGTSYTIWDNNTFDLRSFADAAINLPIKGTQRLSIPNLPLETRNVRAPLQWSAGIGLGLHYNINNYFSIYAAPGVRYYFGKENDVKTIYTDSPLEFTMSVGLSFRISSFL